MNKKSLALFGAFALSVMVSMGFSQMEVMAETEVESNNTATTAQVVSVGTEVNGVLTEVDDYTEDVDYYKFSVKKGEFYKITLYNMVDASGWDTMLVYLLPETELSDGDSLVGSFDLSNQSKIFRAEYTGEYYLEFDNAASSTTYSFLIETYDPEGVRVQDADYNTYTILADGTLELTKLYSKKSTESFWIGFSYSYPTITEIEGMSYVNRTDAPLYVSSIGDYVCKGCKFSSVHFGEYINHIGKGAFQNCKNIGTDGFFGVTFSGKKVVIEKNAFSNCKKLSSIKIDKDATIKSVGKNAFKGSKKGIRVYVPKIAKYKKLFKKAGFKRADYSKTD